MCETMRKLVLQMQISIDGFVCGPDGELDWMFPDFDERYTKWTVEKVGQAGAHLMGRATYAAMASHWPTSTEPFAPPMNEIPKIVFSNSLKEAPWRETRIVGGDLRQTIGRLKEESGKELLVHGGARLAGAVVSAGLVDEYRLVEHPVALGKGLSIFSGLAAPTRLTLVEAIKFESGAVAKVYRPRGGSFAR
jgi:dihydrofolate reductase